MKTYLLYFQIQYNIIVANGALPHEKYLEFGGIVEAKRLLLFLAYYEQDTFPQLTTKARNEQIKNRYGTGESISILACKFGISPQRVHQIVKTQKLIDKWERGISDYLNMQAICRHEQQCGLKTEAADKSSFDRIVEHIPYWTTLLFSYRLTYPPILVQFLFLTSHNRAVQS